MWNKFQTLIPQHFGNYSFELIMIKEGTASNINYNIFYCLFLPTSLYYSLFLINDNLSNLFLFLTLLSVSSLFTPKQHKILHILIALIAVLDLVCKVLIHIGVVSSIPYINIDISLIAKTFQLTKNQFDYQPIIYLSNIFLSIMTAWSFNTNTKIKSEVNQQLKLLQFLSTTLDFITPILLYILCFTKITNNNSFRDWLQKLSPQISGIQLGQFQMFEQVAWGLITAIYLVTKSENVIIRKIITASCVILMIRDHSLEYSNKEMLLYQLKWNYIAIIKAGLLLSFRIHHKTTNYAQMALLKDQNLSTSQDSRMSSHMRYVYRRKINQLNSINHVFVFLLIILTVIALLLTNGLGNILVILGVALNFPSYDQSKFRKFLGLGVTISLLLQPQQFIYFLLLYIVRFIRTQDHTFSFKNWWIINEIGRIVVLFSKVSLLTFLIGLFQNQWLVILTLVFRNFCSYYKLIIVFMGTIDNYLYYVDNIVPKSVYIDLILWSYFLLLKIYSATSSIKFAKTDITNIFQEYPIINYFQKALKILKIFHWIAYAAISLLILNSHPSFFTIMRIIPLVVVFTVGILQSHKSQLSYRLWLWNFYTSLIIAFVKYFYLLSKYDNLSSWLIRILQPLIEHHKFIGLTAPNNASLWSLFAADFVLIVVNAVVLYIIKVQVSQLNYIETRNRIYEEEHLQEKLIEKEVQDGQKNIHYLYNNYIEPINLKFNEKSRLSAYFSDFILDMAFFCFIVVFYLFKSQKIQLNYIPHFALFLFAFCRQKGKHQSPYFFKLFVALSSLDLLFIYVQYFYSLIQGAQIYYDMPRVISKYFLLIIAVFFNSTNIALCQFYNQSRIMKRPEHSFILFTLLTPLIPHYQLKKQVISLYLQIFKILSLAFYISVLISGDLILKQIHLLHLLLFIVIIVIFYDSKMQIFKRYWLYILISCHLADLFMGFSLSMVGLLFLRAYFMILQEFDLQIFIERYDRTNKTVNQQTMKKVEQEEIKLQKKYQRSGKDRLQVISEVKQNRQLEASEKIQEIFWKEKHIFLTIVWLLPIIFTIIIEFGVIFYSQGYFSLAIFTFHFLGLVIALKNLFSFNITHKIFMWLTIAGTITFVLSLAFEFFINENYQTSILQNYGFGLFFVIIGNLGYYELLWYNNHDQANKHHKYSYHITFSLIRSLQAIQYWKKKCQMVSQLGSQIHNEKKMVSLRKYYLNRVNLSIKVEQLENELKSKSAHRKSRFQSLHILEREQEREQQIFKKDEFEVYSNMLTFMSFQDLQLCYLSLNQYYKGELGSNIDLAKSSSQMRQWVLNSFESSFHQTLKKHRQLGLIATSQIIQSNSNVIHMFSVQQHPEAEQQDHQLQLHYHTPDSHNEEMQQAKSEVIKIQDSRIDSPIKLIYKDYQCNSSSPGSRLAQQFGERIDMRLNQLSWPIRKIVQNIQIIGLIITAGWNFYGGVYTIPTNIAIFSWAIVLQTKTTVVFWFFLMIYSFLILAFKLILAYLPQHFFINFLFYYHSNDYFYQFLIIFISAVEIIFLKMGGTSQIAYSQRQNIFDAFYRNILNQAARGKIKCYEQKFLQIYKKMRNANKHSFFYRVFSKGRLKPGKDLYPMLAIIQVFILLYIFFFYDLMQFESKNNRKSLGEILTVTQFSKNMIVALFFQVIIMIADRVIVALNLIDRLNQKIQNFFFNIAFKNDSNHSQLQVEQLQKLGKFDYLLIIKYIFHCILLVLINFFVYFYIPSGGMQKSLIPQCQNAVCGKSYNFLSLFLLLYLVYFVISGLQIKHGFNRNKCRNTLMERFHWIDYYIYMFFTGIPFLWEFKKISDWTITATSLPLFHYMKFQDINARMYQSKCEAEILKIKTLGKGPWYKFLMGPPGFLFLLLIVFSPIVMYSSLNPFAVKDQILAASSRLELVMNGNNHYNFFKTSHTNILANNQLSKTKILGLFDRAELYKLESSSYPDEDFSLSQPAVQHLSQNLRKAAKLQMKFEFEFRLIVDVSQKVGGDSSFVWGSKQLSQQQIEQLYKIITSEVSMIEITSFFSPLPGQINNQSIVLYNRNQGQYFELYTKKFESVSETIQGNLKGIFVFYKSSVKYKIAFGLLTFYLTYVVLINSLCRFYLTGGLEITLFQGPQLQKILFLCQAVRSARILQNFYQEQYLYFSLVDLMRYPRMIKNIADDFSNLRKPIKAKSD